MKKILKLKISGMHCESCEKLIKSELEELAGISQINIVAKAGTGEIEYDDQLVKPKEIVDGIGRAGYQSEVIGADADQPETTDLEVVTKKLAAGKPLKIRLESKVEAEGHIMAGADGQPMFDGKVKTNNMAEVHLPKGVKQFKVTDDLLQAINLFKVFGSTGGQKSMSSEVPMSVHQRDIVTSQATVGSEKDKRLSLSLSGMHCASCAGI
ncbi:MAG: heavy metal-associated domain-containing protein, partial [Patescibacteria group bacterium]